MRRLASGTWAASNVRSVPSRSSVVISMRSFASRMCSGSERACGGKSWRGSSSSTSAKCSCSRRRGGPWATMRPRSMIDDVIAQQLRFLHVVRREDDGLALRLDRLHQLPEVAARLRVEPGGRLIEKQHRRIVRPARSPAAGAAAGRLTACGRRGSASFSSAHSADHRLDVEAARVEAAEQRDALAHGEEVLQRGLLEEDAGLLAEALAERGVAVADLAGGRRRECLP